MTITEKFQNKRCVFSIECFPPKQTTQMDKMKATLQAMRALNPDFISVTFGDINDLKLVRFQVYDDV